MSHHHHYESWLQSFISLISRSQPHHLVSVYARNIYDNPGTYLFYGAAALYFGSSFLKIWNDKDRVAKLQKGEEAESNDKLESDRHMYGLIGTGVSTLLCSNFSLTPMYVMPQGFAIAALFFGESAFYRSPVNAYHRREECNLGDRDLTPENFFKCVLKLPILDSLDKNVLSFACKGGPLAYLADIDRDERSL